MVQLRLWNPDLTWVRATAGMPKQITLSAAMREHALAMYREHLAGGSKAE